jgi:hypothetical protein
MKYKMIKPSPHDSGTVRNAEKLEIMHDKEARIHELENT